LAGGTATYTVSATVSASATGSLSNTATVAVPSGTTDPTPGNNSATDTDTLTPRADLSITKTDGATEAVPGNGITYTIVATNNGPSNVTGATVSDTLPASLTSVTWTCTASAGSSCTGSGSGNISDTVNLLSGGTATYTVSATVSASATGSLSNTATVAVPSGTTDPTPGNNSATDTDTLTLPNIFDPPSGSKTVNAAGYPELEWRMVWINNGNAAAERVRVVDIIPANTTYVNGSLTCEERGGSARITCMYDTVNNLIIWEGDIAPDPGAANEAAANNEIVITYRTTIGGNVLSVSNQGYAYWDVNGDGSVNDDIAGGQTPVVTDDPATTDPGDPTVWSNAEIPTMTEWGMIIFMLLSGFVAVYYLRKRKQTGN
jgi:uncharacterized repeat protein (TIGR01451 family)